MGHAQKRTNSNDFQKCGRTAFGLQEHANTDILALGALGGRLYHSMSSISVMYDYSPMVCFNTLSNRFTEATRNSRSVTLTSIDSVAVLCPKNTSTRIMIDLGIEGLVCGIIPFACASANVKTSGLEWEVSVIYYLGISKKTD